MINTRHMLVAILIVLMALMLAACQPAEPADEGGDEGAADEGAADEGAADGGEAAAECIFPVEEDAVIVFSGWGDETEQNIYRESIERFNEVCPGVTVDYQPIPEDFQTKLKAAMAGGTAPDVFYVDDQLMTAFAPTGQLLALDPYMEEAGVSRDDFIPQLLTIFEHEGQIYALPKDWGTLGLIYLPAAFAEAGIDEPTVDWTFDDLQTAAEAIAENTDMGGFCMGADWARFAPFAFAHGGTYTNADYTEASVNTPEIQAAAEYIAGLKESGALVTPADVGAGWCGEAIGKELVGMTFEGGWMVNFMRQNYADVEWRATELPAGPEGKADVIFTNGIGVNANTEFPRAAAAFAIFVTGEDNQGEIVQTGFAYSTHPSQLDLVQDENDKAIAQGANYPGTRVAYWGPNTGRVNDAVSKALERLFLGEQTVEESFAQAQEEIQAALEGE